MSIGLLFDLFQLGAMTLLNIRLCAKQILSNALQGGEGRLA